MPSGVTLTLVQRVWGLRYIDDLVCAQTETLGSGGSAPPDGDFANAAVRYALTDRLYSVVAMTMLDQRRVIRRSWSHENPHTMKVAVKFLICRRPRFNYANEFDLTDRSAYLFYEGADRKGFFDHMMLRRLKVLGEDELRLLRAIELRGFEDSEMAGLETVSSFEEIEVMWKGLRRLQFRNSVMAVERVDSAMKAGPLPSQTIVLPDGFHCALMPLGIDVLVNKGTSLLFQYILRAPRSVLTQSLNKAGLLDEMDADALSESTALVAAGIRGDVPGWQCEDFGFDLNTAVPIAVYDVNIDPPEAA